MNLPANSWILQVKPGSMLDIRPLWNRTERSHNQISVPCKVLSVQAGIRGCQSGVLFTVRTIGGNDRTLDAAWFHDPGNK